MSFRGSDMDPDMAWTDMGRLCLIHLEVIMSLIVWISFEALRNEIIFGRLVAARIWLHDIRVIEVRL